MPTKKPPAPAAPPAPMSPAARQAKVKADLERTGGRKLPGVNLPADAHEDLKALLGEGHTITSAVILGLKMAGRRLR